MKPPIAGRRGELAVLPLLGLVRLELVGTATAHAIDAEIARLEGVTISTGDVEAERKIHILAAAVSNPMTGAPVGNAEEWGQLDGEIVFAAWRAYEDLELRLDPARVGDDKAQEDVALSAKRRGKSVLEQARCVYAAELFAFYGRPAVDLTITELCEFLVQAGLVTFKDDYPNASTVYLTKRGKR